MLLGLGSTQICASYPPTGQPWLFSIRISYSKDLQDAAMRQSTTRQSHQILARPER
jgi:hypothetical protein